mgnify:FL=1
MELMFTNKPKRMLKLEFGKIVFLEDLQIKMPIQIVQVYFTIFDQSQFEFVDTKRAFERTY